MAVIILGSGITPVVGTREFYPIPGGGGGGVGTVTIGSGDTNNYVITSTGVGDIIQGESNLQFTGTVLNLTGDLNVLAGGNIAVSAMDNAVTTSILHYNTGTGAISYGASGGGTTNFLRADGTWAAPAGSGITITGVPASNEITTWTSATDITSDSHFTFDGSTLVIGDGGNPASMTLTGGSITAPDVTSAATEYILNWNNSTGLITYNNSGGGTTNFLRADGSWADPNYISISGTPANDQIAIWTNLNTLEGDSTLTFTGGTLTVNSIIEVQKINELTASLGVRFPEKVYIGADGLAVATLEVQATSGSDPVISIDNQASGYGLEINATSAATAQQNIVADAGTNTTVRGLDIVHTTSGTAAAGLGSGLTLSTEYDNGTSYISGAIDAIITDATAASGDARLSFKVRSNNIVTERMVLYEDGELQVDTINELTGLAGVTIEGVLVEDSDVTIATANYLNLNASGTSNIYDNSGVLTFTDGVTGAKTLAQLSATGASFGSQDEIPHMNAGGTDFDYDSNFMWDGSNFDIGTASGAYVTLSLTIPGITTYNNAVSVDSRRVFSNTAAGIAHTVNWLRGGGTVASIAAAPTSALIRRDSHQIHDGTSWVESFRFDVEVDGVIATADFDTKATWDIKEGVGALTQVLELNANGLEYSADHSTDQAANTRWIPDKDYVDTAVAAAGGLSASGTPANDQLAVWVTASTLEGTANLTFAASTLDVNNALTVDTIDEHTLDAGVTIEAVVLENGGITVPDLTGTGIRIVTASAAGLLADGNLSGHVTTTNSLVTSIAAATITDQSALAAFASGDTLLVYDLDATALREGSISALQTYMQNNLSFGTGYAAIFGTPANNQIAVWTGSTDIEGDSALTFDTSTDIVIIGSTSGNSVQVGNSTSPGVAVQAEGAWANVTRVVYSNIASWDSLDINSRYGGTVASPAAAPTDALVKEENHSVYDGTILRASGRTTFQVDGVIATDDFDTKFTWELKEGASAIAEKMSLGVDGLTIVEGLQLGGSAVNFTGLGSDDTEDHIIAIDDSTGLLTKRSVASIEGLWSSDANGITYTAGNVGIGGASDVSITLYIEGSGNPVMAVESDVSDTWTDFDTSGAANRGFLIYQGASVTGVGTYSAITMYSRGAASYQSYVTLAAEALSATDHSTRFNIQLRGTGATHWNTVASFDYDFSYYWKAEFNTQDITHYLQQAGTTVAVFGWDDSSGFQIHTGTSFTSSASADFTINASGNVFMANLSNTVSGNYLYYDSTTKEVTYNTTSDIRLKENIIDWEPDSLSFLMDQRLIKFDRKDGSNYGEIGWDANQMNELMPDLTWIDEKGYFNYYDAHLRFHFHRSIKQLGMIQETQEEKITRLEDRVKELELQIEER